MITFSVAKRSALLSVMLTVILLAASTLLLPASGSAQGQGRGRGLSKKSEKFVNGHDARDGRWDGRGPGSRRFGGRWRRWDRGNRRWGRVRNRSSLPIYVR